MSDTIRGKLCIYKGPLRGKRKGVMLMKKRNYFSVFLTLAVLPALLLCGCEDTAVSYSIAGESQAVSESVDGGSSAADSSSVTGDVSAAGSTSATDSSQEEQKIENQEREPEAVLIQVYVCGAVASPGVYTLPEGSRVYEAVEMAGGLLDTADPRALNQARMLSDGEQVTVLTVEEVQNGETVEQGSVGEDLSGVSGASDGGKVNINTADEAGLMTIPGIGESRAKAIIAYREENGKFESIEDIMKIDGIKEKMFDKIKDSITVS